MMFLPLGSFVLRSVKCKAGNRSNLFSGLCLSGLPFDAEGSDMKKKAIGGLILLMLYAALTCWMVVSSGWLIAAKTWGITIAIVSVVWVAVSLMNSEE